jgi:lipopolysaccharide transport system ATP-binding protein
MANNAAVIFVSHNMNDIARICDKCLVLSDGLIVHNGNVEEGISKYLEDSDDGSVYDDSFEKVEYPVKTVKFEWSKLNIDYGETIELSIYIETDKEMKDIGLQIPFYDNQSMVAGEWYSKRYHKTINLNKGLNELNIKLGPLYLKKGLYKIAIILSDSMGIGFPVWSYKSHTLGVNGPAMGGWPYQIMGVVK